MSYASAVADHGPKQTEAEKAAPQPAELNNTSAPSAGGAGQDAPRADELHGRIDVISREAADERDRLARAAERAGSGLRREAGELEEDAKAAGRKAAKESRKALGKADSVARQALKDPRTYNAIDAVILGALGYAGYRRYQEGTLRWQDVGVATLGLGLFAGAQNYAQAWFRKNL